MLNWVIINLVLRVSVERLDIQNVVVVFVFVVCNAMLFFKK